MILVRDSVTSLSLNCVFRTVFLERSLLRFLCVNCCSFVTLTVHQRWQASTWSDDVTYPWRNRRSPRNKRLLRTRGESRSLEKLHVTYTWVSEVVWVVATMVNHCRNRLKTWEETEKTAIPFDNLVSSYYLLKLVIYQA